MNKAFGIALLAVGIVLLVFGISETDSFSLTSYWNERKAPETGAVPISSGYTLGFWRSREERCQAQSL